MPDIKDMPKINKMPPNQHYARNDEFAKRAASAKFLRATTNLTLEAIASMVQFSSAAQCQNAIANPNSATTKKGGFIRTYNLLTVDDAPVTFSKTTTHTRELTRSAQI